MEEGNIRRAERHSKGWGFEDWIVNNEKYCGKILHFEIGKRCSVHYHKIKQETFYLLSGKLEVLLADSPENYATGKTEVVELYPGEILDIWPGRVHQMTGHATSDLMEVSTHHLEEDSYRIVKGD